MSPVETLKEIQARREFLEEDIDVESFLLRLVGRKTRIDVTDSIISGTITRTIEGASNITVTVHDQARKLLASNIFTNVNNGKLRAVDLRLDGQWWRLVHIGKSGNDLNMTFEDRDVAYLRAHKGPRKASRGKLTRAEFILSLTRKVKVKRIIFRAHELHKRQPITTAKQAEPKAERKGRKAKGFDDGARPGGLNPTQLKRVERCLNVAESLKASARPTKAMLCAMAGESGFGENVGTRGTTFQTLKIPESDLEAQAHHFLKGGRSFLAGGAIGYARAHPDASAGEIASKVEISDKGADHYDKAGAAAKVDDILEAWGGATGNAGDSSTSVTVAKRYEFKVDKGETYWDAAQRLAKEVEWRLFMNRGILYYISEEDLFKQAADFRIAESDPGIINIDFEVDTGKPAATATVTARMDRWDADPGDVIIIDDRDLGPGHGRWLVASIERNLFSAETTINLKTPTAEKAEPAHDTSQKETKSSGGTGSDSSDPALANGLVYPLAIHGSDLGGVSAHMARAFGNWQSDNAVDIGCPMGTNVYAVDDGTVVKLGGHWDGTGNSNPNGWNVTLKTKSNSWFYTHLRSRNPDIKVGSKVKAGKYLGESGAANGVKHLHIGCLHGDPETLLDVKGTGAPAAHSSKAPGPRQSAHASTPLGQTHG